MNKTELIAVMAETSGLSKKDCDAALAAFITTVETALKSGEKVQLIGFGSFEVKERAARTGRNPRTKEIVEISATAQHTLDGFKETAKIFEQGRKYYDALKAVHDVVKGGVKVKKSIGLVADISEIYVRNYQKMLGDPNYTPDELETISFGYAKLLSESADILQDLKNVVNVTGMSLSDAERLAIIDQSYKRLLEYRNLVQYYTDKNISVSYLRAKKKKDADRVVALYGDAEDRYW